MCNCFNENLALMKIYNVLNNIVISGSSGSGVLRPVSEIRILFLVQIDTI